MKAGVELVLLERGELSLDLAGKVSPNSFSIDVGH